MSFVMFRTDGVLKVGMLDAGLSEEGVWQVVEGVNYYHLKPLGDVHGQVCIVSGVSGS